MLRQYVFELYCVLIYYLWLIFHHLLYMAASDIHNKTYMMSKLQSQDSRSGDSENALSRLDSHHWYPW